MDNEYKKIKPRDWDKDKFNDVKEDQLKPDKEGSVFESKVYRDQSKVNSNVILDKKKKLENDKKENSIKDDEQDDYNSRNKRDKVKESPREQKSKKYSDTRKERIKQNEFVKSDKQSVISKIISTDNKGKINPDDIKPFTQLPQVKTDDLTKIIDSMDKKLKVEDVQQNMKDTKDETVNNDAVVPVTKTRRSSLESGEAPVKDEFVLKRQKSLDDRGKSTDREGSEEKEKSESSDRRTERRIRNKVYFIGFIYFYHNKLQCFPTCVL